MNQKVKPVEMLSWIGSNVSNDQGISIETNGDEHDVQIPLCYAD